MEHILSVGGGSQRKVVFSGPDRLVSVGPNGVLVRDLDDLGNLVASQHFAPSQSKLGVNVINNSSQGKFAISCKSSGRCPVFVFESAEKRHIAKLENGAELEHSALGLSRDSQRVAAIGAQLDQELIVWDVSKAVVLCSAKTGLKASQLSFSPMDNDIVCVSGDDGIAFYEVHQAATGTELRMLSKINKVVDEQANSETVEQDETVDKPSGFLGHCWSKEGHVVAVAKDSSLIKVDPHSGKILKVIKAFGASSIQAIRNAFIVGCEDGQVKWLKESSWSELESISLGSSAPVDQLVMSSDFEKCLAITADGRQVLFKTSAPQEKDKWTQVISASHTGSVLGIAPVYTNKDSHQLASSSLMASVGQDGRYCVWNCNSQEASAVPLISQQLVQQGAGGKEAVDQQKDKDKSKQAVPPQTLSAIASSPACIFTLVGSSTGHIMPIFHYQPRQAQQTNKPIAISVGPSFRAHNSCVSTIKFDPRGKLFASMGSTDDCLCVFLAPESATEATFPLVGVVEVEGHSLLACSWDRTDNALWIAASERASSTAKAFRVDPSSLQALQAGSTIHLAAEQSGVLSTGTTQVGDLIALESGRFVATVSHQPKVLDVFEAMRASNGTTSLQSVGKASCAAHEGPLWTLASNYGSSHFAAGSVDGAVSVWDDAENITDLEASQQTWSGACSCVSSIAFTCDGKQVVTGHVDGTLSVLSLEGVKSPSVFREPVVCDHPVDDKALVRSMNKSTREILQSSTTECDKWKKHTQDMLDQEFDRKKQIRREKVDKLRHRLLQLLENNETLPDLEKLDRDEFVVDTEGKKTISDQNERDAEELRATILRKIKGRELVFDRIKEECWDSMETHSRQVRGLEKKIFVRNFPIPKQSQADQRHFTRVKQLRSVELDEIRRASAADDSLNTSTTKGKNWASRKLLKMIPQGADWIVNAGILEPLIDLSETSNTVQEGKKDKSSAKSASREAPGEHDSTGEVPEDDDVDEAQNEGEAGGASADGDKTSKSAEEAGDKANGDGHHQGSTSEDGKASVIFGLLELLYHPAALRTSFQKRSQLILLKQLQREMMIAFNQKFDAAIEQKEEAVEKIATRYERINEILSELRQDAQDMPSFWDATETPDSIFHVSDVEVGVDKYLSKSERARLAKEEEERRRREEEAAKDNFNDRALQDMMNGTLEAAKELTLAEQEMERPEWMQSIPYADMSDEQRREYDEFEAKFQKFSEEKEKYIKSLEQEMKKLHAEVGEIMKTYDDSLDELSRLKLNVLENITIQSLYASRTALSLLRQEDYRVQAQQLEEKIQQTRKVLEQVEADIRGFSEEFEQSKAVLAEKQASDKAMERAFKPQLQEYTATHGSQDGLDLEMLRILQQVFKIRAGKKHNLFLDDAASYSKGSFRNLRDNGLGSSRSKASHEEGLDNQQEGKASSSKYSSIKNGRFVMEKVSLDPFAVGEGEDEKSQREQERALALAPLSREKDLPEGFHVEQQLWDFVQKLRIDKIKSELIVKEEMDQVAKLQSQYDELEGKRRDLEQRLSEYVEALEQVNTNSKYDAQNLELIVRIKQGQDEVKAGAVITDYSNSLLLHRAVVENVNKEIVALGETKVGIMNKMKEFRKSINFMQWERKFLLQQEYDLEEHYTDLHMLRVTRELQEIIKGGEVADKQEQTQQAESKLVKLNKVLKSKLHKAELALNRIQGKKDELLSENAQLQEKIQELRASVGMRDSILQARGGESVLATVSADNQLTSKKKKRAIPTSSPVGSGASAAKSRMKSIVTRRKLVDLARAQQDEIEFLKQEIEQLRERNFPRFANPSAAFAEKRFRSHPDQR